MQLNVLVEIVEKSPPSRAGSLLKKERRPAGLFARVEGFRLSSA
jgi:hypothetical protein